MLHHCFRWSLVYLTWLHGVSPWGQDLQSPCVPPRASPRKMWEYYLLETAGIGKCPKKKWPNDPTIGEIMSKKYLKVMLNISETRHLPTQFSVPAPPLRHWRTSSLVWWVVGKVRFLLLRRTWLSCSSCASWCQPAMGGMGGNIAMNQKASRVNWVKLWKICSNTSASFLRIHHPILQVDIYLSICLSIYRSI